MVSVSVVIPSYNSSATIKECLKSILGQSAQDHILEILIVDSSNDDHATRTQIKEFSEPRIKLIELEQKTIPALGRNMGAENAQGELLVFIDSDIYLSEDWLEKVLHYYQQSYLVGGGSISLPPAQHFKMIPEAQLYLQFNEFLHPSNNVTKPFLPSCNMFCQKSLFDAVGGFPDIRASEDVLFFLKFKDKENVWFVPKAKSFHIFRNSWEGFRNNQILLGKYVAIYRRSYYQSWIYRGFMPYLLTPLFVLIKFFRICMRVFKTGPRHSGHFLVSLPMFLIGLIFWSYGFLQGFAETQNATVSSD